MNTIASRDEFKPITLRDKLIQRANSQLGLPRSVLFHKKLKQVITSVKFKTK